MNDTTRYPCIILLYGTIARPDDMGAYQQGVGTMKIKGSRTIEELFRDDKVIDRAMRRGVAGALLRHKRAGVSVVVWRSGEVVRIKPSQIKVSRNGSRRSRAVRSSRAGKRSRAV